MSKSKTDATPDEFRILCPTGHLSYTRLEAGSFALGLERKPHAICADAGSCDPGPYPLGADVSASPSEWQFYDLEKMLLAARQLKVPMIVGSANDTGSNTGVDKFVEMIRQIASRHQLEPFRLAAIHHRLQKSDLLASLDAGTPIPGLGSFGPLTREAVEATAHFVPVMGVEPIVQALEQGAEVVITSRTSDCCIFAAPAIHAGVSKDLAYYTGKVMECASFCAEPYMAKESILGTIRPDGLYMNRCTPANAALRRRSPAMRCTSATTHTARMWPGGTST